MNKQKIVATLRECLEATWGYRDVIRSSSVYFLTDVENGLEATASKLKDVIAELEASDGHN